MLSQCHRLWEDGGAYLVYWTTPSQSGRGQQLSCGWVATKSSAKRRFRGGAGGGNVSGGAAMATASVVAEVSTGAQ